jgi:hypothetical protein
MRAPMQLTFLTKSYLLASSTSTKSSQPAIYARVANDNGLLLHSNLYYQTLKRKKKKKIISIINIGELIIPLGSKIKGENDVKINIF